MRRQVSVLLGVVAVLVALVALVATATVVGAARDDGKPGGWTDRSAMMGGAGGWHGRRPPGRGWMPGPMHGARLDGEAAWLAHMVAHHEEAVAAARELSRSDRAAMRSFGRSVVSSQSRQIRWMTTWLAEWYPDHDPDAGYRPMMRDLGGLSGDALDRAFLEDMTGHHMMAVMQSQQLLVRGLAAHDRVADLARTIRDEQRREIWWMQRRLARWFDAAAGPGPGRGPCPAWARRG